MTFSTWFCVDKFSVIADAHPVRLLTVVRNLQGRDENLVCLSVTLTSKERSLIVSTQETQLPNAGIVSYFEFEYSSSEAWWVKDRALFVSAYRKSFEMIYF